MTDPIEGALAYAEAHKCVLPAGHTDCPEYKLVVLADELRRQSQELERAREALRNMVAAYDLADEQGMFSDHGENHEAGMSCPG